MTSSTVSAEAKEKADKHTNDASKNDTIFFTSYYFLPFIKFSTLLNLNFVYYTMNTHEVVDSSRLAVVIIS